MRTEPGVSADSVELEPLLWEGARAFVLDGPVAASGYDWYLLAPLGEVDQQFHPDPPVLGWAAAADKDGELWLAPDPGECPAHPLAGAVPDFEYPPDALVNLACFGDRDLTFEARLVETSGDCGEPLWRIEPSLFDSCAGVPYYLAAAEDDASGQTKYLSVAFDERSGTALPDGLHEPHEWLPVRVTGQFAHPLAESCRAEPIYDHGEDPRPAELVILDCRSQFFVRSLEFLE